MDPISQAVVGATLSQSVAGRKRFGAATAAGLLGGLLPDVDSFIRSSTDPLLALEFHRHFTHALIMVPVLALPVAGVVWFFSGRKKAPFRLVYLYAFLGVLSHGLLDACTTYGTQLLWPFSDYRVAWHNISIVDPLFTVPLLIAVVWAAVRKKARIAQGAMVFMLGYLLLGVYQRDAATEAARELAASRGHEDTVRLEAKPSLGNLVLWRTLYETRDGVYYVDAVHTVPFLGAKVYEGGSVEKWTPAELSPAPPADSVLARDIARFNWFSDDYLYQSHQSAPVVGDLRYSMLPNSLDPLWGITFDPGEPDEHVDLQYFRVVDEARGERFKGMLLRREPGVASDQSGSD